MCEVAEGMVLIRKSRINVTEKLNSEGDWQYVRRSERSVIDVLLHSRGYSRGYSRAYLDLMYCGFKCDPYWLLCLSSRWMIFLLAIIYRTLTSVELE